MPDSAFLITAFATLFVVIDPPGLVPLFIALTRGMDAARRKAMARRACLIAAVLLTGFGLAGEAVLGFIGISMPAFRIAGGLLLFLTALDMLFERRTQRREGQQAEPDHDPSVFPLATPLIAGPGAIASMILLVGQGGGGWATAWVVPPMLCTSCARVLRSVRTARASPTPRGLANRMPRISPWVEMTTTPE